MSLPSSLVRSQLFAGLSGTDLEAVSERMRPRQFAPGEQVCTAGEPSDRIWLITEGLVQWVAGTTAGGGEIELRMRKGDVIARGGIDARIANIPFDRAIEAWHANGVPGYVSNSAGTFVGNQALYETLALTEHSSSPVLAGLVHLPYLPAQAIAAGSQSNPSMSLETMKKGIDLLIETIVPWVEQRTPEASKAREKGRAMWIPRGVKEVER